MPGGRGAVYVRAKRRAGKIVVTAEINRLAKQKVAIAVRSTIVNERNKSDRRRTPSR